MVGSQLAARLTPKRMGGWGGEGALGLKKNLARSKTLTATVLAKKKSFRYQSLTCGSVPVAPCDTIPDDDDDCHLGIAGNPEFAKRMIARISNPVSPMTILNLIRASLQEPRGGGVLLRAKSLFTVDRGKKEAQSLFP